MVRNTAAVPSCCIKKMESVDTVPWGIQCNDISAPAHCLSRKLLVGPLIPLAFLSCSVLFPYQEERLRCLDERELPARPRLNFSYFKEENGP